MNGEKWVLANVPHDYGDPFPLHAALSASVPAIVEPGRVLIAGTTTKGFEMDKLVYFGASVFWRGAAHSWKPVDGQRVPQVHLGTYQEQLRKFLLGKSSFPVHVSLTLMVWPYNKVLPAALLPRSVHVNGWERYWFYISGLGFVLDFGKKLPSEIRNRCTSHSPEQFITVSVKFGEMVRKVLRQELMSKDLSRIEPTLKEIASIRSF